MLEAISLLTTCEDKIISNHTSYQLATRLAITLAINCGAACVQIPNASMSLREDLSSLVGDTKWDFTAVVVNVINLQDDIANLQITYPPEISGRAKELDGQLESLETTLLSFWTSRNVSMSAHPLLFGISYDVYQNYFIAQVQNAFRIIRLLLNNIIIKHCPLELFVTRNDAGKAIDILTKQICALVTPFVLPESPQGNEARFLLIQTL